jgi:glycosyltransferase involved in cell wall biosynthesis
VIPTCGRAGPTRRAIESVLAQTLPALEILVVEDGSSDPDLPTAFGEDADRIRVLAHPMRLGAAAARNTGIEAARCDWIAFLDSDDRWFPQKLARQFAQLEADGWPDNPLCCCNILVRAPGRKARPHNRTRPRSPLSEWLLIGGNTAQTSGLMLRAELARELRFDPALTRHQDWDFLLRAAAAGARISYVQEPLLEYDDSPAPDRISNGLRASDTLRWVERSGRLITARARHAVLCTQLFSGRRPGGRIHGIARLASAVAEGRLDAGPTLAWLLRAAWARLAGRRRPA